MVRGTFRKTIALVMISAILAGSFASLNTASAQSLINTNTDNQIDTNADNQTLTNSNLNNTTTSNAAANDYGTERLSNGYSKVSKNYKAKSYTGATKTFLIEETENKELIAKDSFGYSSKVCDLKPGDELTLKVEAPETALYYINFDYYSYDSSILPIELSLMIDGNYPFYEARGLEFEVSWKSSDGQNLDRYGNEIVTMPTKDMKWETKALSDASYRYSEPLKVELTKGTHEFKIEVNEGKFLLGNISLSAPETIKAYAQSTVAEGKEIITIEAEQFSYRNDSSIHAVCEYDTALTPVSAKEKVLNVVDGDSFRKAGQTIGYKFNVEKEGYYYIGMNYRQSDKNDFPVFVDYKIDGEFPNDAFRSYSVNYTSKYRNMTLSDENGQNLSVYLTKGEHEITLTISADNLRYALEKADEIMNGINDLSLEVTKVAGTNKDKYRDLTLTRYIPDVEEKLNGWADELYEIAQIAGEYVDAKSPEDVAAFAYLIIAAKQLRNLAEEPNELIYRVAELSTSVNSINTQIANFIDIITKNNLSIDRIYIYQEDAKLPKKLNAFKSAFISIQRFFYSFFGDTYSTKSTDKTHIQVWVNRPRQYVEIMQKMIDDEFTPKTGIEVDLAIMTDVNKLVLSNASGDTPDIATGINYAFPFEIGIRDALVDMTQFDNYQEVFGRYSDGILVSSVIEDKLISLPETMNFYVLFYRKDILGKLGMSVPDTMEDLVAMLPDLQMRGLNVYYPTAAMLSMRNFHGVTPLIFQNNGRLYGDTALDLMIDSEETIEGFTQLTELFTLYDLPVDVPNFYQHFRNGDLPLGIADFNSYNLILNAAPEIANSWGIALVPGVYDEESGEVLRYMSGGAESSVMFKTDREREERAWAFLDWWSSADVQAEFGQMLQILYGDEYIWPTANLEAFMRLPFPTSDKNIILSQAENILEAPRLLGSYMLERELSNAFNDIVVNGKILRSRMDDVVKVVNRETERKLAEFGYMDQEGNIIKDYPVPDVKKVREILERKKR